MTWTTHLRDDRLKFISDYLIFIPYQNEQGAVLGIIRQKRPKISCAELG